MPRGRATWRRLGGRSPPIAEGLEERGRALGGREASLDEQERELEGRRRALDARAVELAEEERLLAAQRVALARRREVITPAAAAPEPVVEQAGTSFAEGLRRLGGEA